MVRGLNTFKEYFGSFPENYIIIGGSACDMIIEGEGLIPRATKDIDIILVVEALNTDFVRQFWKFIEDGQYERKEKHEEERKYYRFLKPLKEKFPFQVELFSRNPDLLDLEESTKLTPIPVDDDLTSLSAILLDEDYYKYLMDHSTIEDGVHRANTEALICMKARAFLDLSERKARGDEINEKNIRKHKSDVFRLVVLLTEEDTFKLPGNIEKDMQAFTDVVTDYLPDKAMFRSMGLGDVNPESVFEQLKKSFQLK
jgi:hypothetical protein